MAKKYLSIDVLTAAKERLAYVFEEFELVVVSFSGGKDSTVVLNLALEYAAGIDALDRLAVFHVDYEAQYDATTDFVTETFLNLPDGVQRYWMCLPVKAQCSTSMFQDHWRPWDREDMDIWTRQLPEYDFVLNEDNAEFDYSGSDYDTQDNFMVWLSESTGKTVCSLVGIRAQESLRRYHAVNAGKISAYNGLPWITCRRKKGTDFWQAYPVYDWVVEDIWTAYARFGWSYNKLYDLMYLAGVPIGSMRVASPFNDAAQESLKLYKVLEPSKWGQLISRVNGVNFTGTYGGTTAMGWKSITKPAHFTWRQYAEFLLSTLPDEVRQRYESKLAVSMKYWRESGAGLRDETVADLEAAGVPIIRSGAMSNYGTIPREKIIIEEYLDDIDIPDFKDVPTWKRLCICIMKNDLTCAYMGFGKTKEEYRKRREALDKWSNLL